MKALAILLLTAALLTAQKKPKPDPEPPKTYASERVFGAPCDAVWPAALQVLIAEGWEVKTSDKAGGLLALRWTKGYRYGNSRAVNPLVSQHTKAPVSGFKHQFTRFEIVSASVIATPAPSGCRYSVAVTYHGDEITLPTRALESNGWFEDKMLNEIETKLAAK
jgi:hypothetical protein